MGTIFYPYILNQTPGIPFEISVKVPRGVNQHKTIFIESKTCQTTNHDKKANLAHTEIKSIVEALGIEQDTLAKTSFEDNRLVLAFQDGHQASFKVQQGLSALQPA